ncbi:hypothetical protein BLL52_4286 [Rhodoferax antarcticus ANT.BR]|uniref:Uncharacterized protein n=1 Tax=Rhodoferax antarcticus ANT.BR TaxID=1111071 RepID=A0A1Q8Y951_9BURK|nr:hypothetical protein BLL52_4286 [Rhodoferax antarcticus ANT.BR]
MELPDNAEIPGASNISCTPVASMGLKEAITHAEVMAVGDTQCARDHGQLAIWLRELEACRADAALGYDPMTTKEAVEGREVNATGAANAVLAMVAARKLIDSVAYVAKEGDKDNVLAAIDAAI